MSTALFRFRLRVESTAQAGVVFVDWCPQGRRDAITLSSVDKNTILLLWIESRQGFDPNYRVHDATSLHGEVQVRGMSADDIALLARPHQVMQEESSDGRRYRVIVKNVVQMVHTGVSRLLDQLMTNFGQYWLLPADTYQWDSRFRSLGEHAFFDLHLERSVDGGDEWSDFMPGSAEFHQWRASRMEGGDSVEPDSSLYISRHDWRAIEQSLSSTDSEERNRDELRLVTSLFTETKREYSLGYYSYAFVLASTVLELALNHYIRRIGSTSRMLESALQPLRELRLPFKFSSVAVHLPLSTSHIELTLSAIAIRNEIVHEGRELREDNDVVFDAIVRSIVALLPRGEYRLPPHPNEFW